MNKRLLEKIIEEKLKEWTPILCSSICTEYELYSTRYRLEIEMNEDDFKLLESRAHIPLCYLLINSEYDGNAFILDYEDLQEIEDIFKHGIIPEEYYNAIYGFYWDVIRELICTH